MNLVNEDYSRACTEVIEILNNMCSEDKNKIPPELLDELELNSDKEYEFSLDYSKELTEQNLLPETRALLYNLFVDYLASKKTRREYRERQRMVMLKAEDEKRKKYSPDNIFNNTEEKRKDNMLIVKPKETIFDKIINFLRSLFK